MEQNIISLDLPVICNSDLNHLSNILNDYSPDKLNEIITTQKEIINNEIDTQKQIESNVQISKETLNSGEIHEIPSLNSIQVYRPQPPKNYQFLNITEYLHLPQLQVAKILGVPVSSLSKRWNEAVVNRPWPHRKISKIDKEIYALLINMPQGVDVSIPPALEMKLGKLLRERQQYLEPVTIRL